MKKFTVSLFAGLLIACTGLSGQTGTNQNNLFEKCKLMAGDNAIYLKDFVVKFPAVKEGQDPMISKNTVMLSKNIRYRFSVCNSEQYNGEAIIQLYDESKMLISNLNPGTGKIYPSFDFVCNKTGKYNILISFKEGAAGEAVGIMSYIRQ